MTKFNAYHKMKELLTDYYIEAKTTTEKPIAWITSGAPVEFLYAMDILPMEPLPGVTFVQGDFREEEVLDELLAVLEGREIDLVMSDIAPNISGMDAVDQPRAMYLAELAVDFAGRVLRPGGDLLIKVFQGEGFDELIRGLRGNYNKVVIRKPRASRPRSREVYALARGLKI